MTYDEAMEEGLKNLRVADPTVPGSINLRELLVHAELAQGYFAYARELRESKPIPMVFPMP